MFVAKIKSKWRRFEEMGISSQRKGILLQSFRIHQDLSFGGFALKIEFVVFVYELFIYEYYFLLFGYVIVMLLVQSFYYNLGSVSMWLYLTIIVCSGWSYVLWYSVYVADDSGVLLQISGATFNM